MLYADTDIFYVIKTTKHLPLHFHPCHICLELFHKEPVLSSMLWQQKIKRYNPCISHNPKIKKNGIHMPEHIY